MSDIAYQVSVVGYPYLSHQRGRVYHNGGHTMKLYCLLYPALRVHFQQKQYEFVQRQRARPKHNDLQSVFPNPTWAK